MGNKVHLTPCPSAGAELTVLTSIQMRLSDNQALIAFCELKY